MDTPSIWHWLVFAGVWIGLLLKIVSPVLGIVRGVKNSSSLNAIASAFIPIYGVVYYFVARRA